MWERSHYYADAENMTDPVECYTPDTTGIGEDPNRDVEPANGTADECEAVTTATGMGGSQCDIFKKQCTLPYRLRETATILSSISR